MLASDMTIGAPAPKPEGGAAPLRLGASRPRLRMDSVADGSRVAFGPNDRLVLRTVAAYRAARAQYEDGTLDGAHFRMARIQAGVHLQRAPSTRYMVRIKVPYGLLTVRQLRTLAAATRWGSPDLHLTTRQAVEFHDVSLQDTSALLTEMAAAGLPGWEAGGNSVRNVTGCPRLGTCPLQSFDPVPAAREIIRDFFADPALEYLPRKIKVGISGCAEDCAGIRLQDIGCLAWSRQGVPGFSVYVGGGIGAAPKLGECLAGFVPVPAMPALLKAVIRTFDRLGNRQNRHRARLKWLVGEMGMAAFRGAVEEEYAAAGGLPLSWQIGETGLGRPAARAEVPPDILGVDRAWLQHCCHPERDGRWAVALAWPGGAVPPSAAAALADWAQSWGSGPVSITTRQEIIVHGVDQADLPELYAQIAAERPEQVVPCVPVVSCPGAPYCNLAITHSGALAQALAVALLDDARIHQAQRCPELTIRVAGCPHSCSHARFAALGLIGGGARLGSRMIPVYTLFLGGKEGLEPMAGVPTVRIPAKRVPEAVLRMLSEFRQTAAADESFVAWAIRRGILPARNRPAVQ